MKPGFLALASPQGAAEFRLRHPDRRPAQQPALVSLARDRTKDLAVVLLGEILYRDDLADLVPEISEPESVSDAGVALAVYRRAGLRGLARLEGEFALAVWDGAARRLVALRDPCGSWPLFWLVRDKGVAVSTSLEALTHLQAGRAVDPEFLAEFLMWPNPHTELPCERTAFAGVRRLLPGTILELNADGAVQRHRYWDWEARVRPAAVTTVEEAGARFADLFRRAVRERVRRGPVAAHLSGGMDSSGVVCVARDLLAARTGGPRLHTLSMVYRRPSLAGERAFIDLVLAQGGPVEPHFVDGEAVPDYVWFQEGVPFHEEPYAGLPGVGMQQRLVDVARRVGARTVLSGQGSDEILASHPGNVADLLRRGRLWAALREARRWALALNTGVWSILHQFGFELLWPVLLHEGVGTWWRGGVGRWPGLGWFSVPPWIFPDFARAHGLRQRGLAHARRLFASPIGQSLERNMLETGAGDWARWYLAAPHGLTLSHPFRDPRLICFALGIPDRLRNSPERRKPVLEAALRGVLPEAIRTRREKRGFNDVYGSGLARSLRFLEHMVHTSPVLQLGILDPRQLVPAMRQAALGVGDIRDCERLDKTLALIAWYNLVEQRRPVEEWGERHCIRGGADGAKPDRAARLSNHFAPVAGGHERGRVTGQ